MQFTLGPTTVTKELILNSVSEETLMEHYLGVPVKKGLFFYIYVMSKTN